MGLFYMARTFRRKTGRKTRSNKKSTRRSRRKIIRGGLSLSFTSLLALAASFAGLRGANANFGGVKHDVVLTKNDDTTIKGRIGTYDPIKGITRVYIDPKDASGLNIVGSDKTYKFIDITDCDNRLKSVEVSTNQAVIKDHPEYKPKYVFDTTTTCSNE
jgi:hypothetical protein